MSPALAIPHLILGASGSSLLLGLVVFLGAFTLEDPTTVLVGVLAADGVIPVPLAIIALFLGIILGDLALYGLGRSARTHPKLGRLIEHDLVVPLKVWLESRYVLTIFSVRFVPGLRLPTYAASGFFRASFRAFLLTAVSATLLWTTLLFTLSYWFGAATSAWLDSVRYGIAGAFLLILLILGRHNLKSYRVSRERGTNART